MTKNKSSELNFNEMFFVFDFHFNNKREHYDTKLKINRGMTQEMINNKSLYYYHLDLDDIDCRGEEIYWNWDFWEKEFSKYKRKYNKIYKYIKEASDNYNLIYDEDKGILLIFDPERKYKDVTFLFQE